MSSRYLLLNCLSLAKEQEPTDNEEADKKPDVDKQELTVKATEDPFLYKENSAMEKAWKAAEMQQKELPKPDPKPAPDIEFKEESQDTVSVPPPDDLTPRHEPVKHDAVSIPPAEGMTPRKTQQKADTVSIPPAEGMTPRKIQPKADTISIPPAEGLTPRKTQQKADAVSIPPAEGMTPTKLPQQKPDAVSIPPAEGVTPIKTQQKADAVSIPPGEPITPLHKPTAVEDDAVSVPAAEGETPHHRVAPDDDSDTFSVPGAQFGTPKHGPAAAAGKAGKKLEKPDPKGPLKKPVKVPARKTLPTLASKKAATKENSEPYKHKPRVEVAKPRYGISLKKEEKAEPDMKVIPYGYVSPAQEDGEDAGPLKKPVVPDTKTKTPAGAKTKVVSKKPTSLNQGEKPQPGKENTAATDKKLPDPGQEKTTPPSRETTITGNKKPAVPSRENTLNSKKAAPPFKRPTLASRENTLNKTQTSVKSKTNSIKSPPTKPKFPKQVRMFLSANPWLFKCLVSLL